MKKLIISPKRFGSNCYILISSGKALIVDPSISIDTITEALDAEGATPVGVLLTHGHFDHITSIDKIRDKYSIPVYIHKNDADMLTDGHKNAFFVFFRRDCVYRPADVLVEDGSVIELGDEKITVVHTPGHSEGSVCYHCGDFLLTGDTLFSDNIGRSDLYGGDDQKLRDSLDRLESDIDLNITIFPGHGPENMLALALDNVAFFRN